MIKPNQEELLAWCQRLWGSLMTREQLSSLLGIPSEAIDRLIADERLPSGMAVRLGPSVRFDERIAKDWLSAGCPCDFEGSIDARKL
jgi:predicted DNA-binding transcriptional regulator AlpA